MRYVLLIDSSDVCGDPHRSYRFYILYVAPETDVDQISGNARNV